MNCLLTCMVWIGGIGYYDQCPGKVRVVYSSANYYYVQLLQGPTIMGDDIKLEMKIQQQVDKHLCKKLEQ